MTFPLVLSIVAVGLSFAAAAMVAVLVWRDEFHQDQSTEEIEIPPTMRIGPHRLEDLGGPARPLPPYDHKRRA